MPALSPFRALHYSRCAGPLPELISVPGERNKAAINPNHISLLVDQASISTRMADGILTEETQPAVFVYRQRFRFPGEPAEHLREGITAVLNGTADIFPHEQVCGERVAGCRKQLQDAHAHLSSLLLWCSDEGGTLHGLLATAAKESPWKECWDDFNCCHQIWKVTDAALMKAMQDAMRHKTAILADGHHRFAAQWKLATIQIRTDSFQTFAAHRLVTQTVNMQIPPACGLADSDALGRFWAATPPGIVRFGMALSGSRLFGIEIPCAPGERNVSVLRRRILRDAQTKPIRGILPAVEAVEAGMGPMAFLLQPLAISAIEEDAGKGLLLPPKSTDFFPKLAAGLVMHRIPD